MLSSIASSARSDLGGSLCRSSQLSSVACHSPNAHDGATGGSTFPISTRTAAYLLPLDGTGETLAHVPQQPSGLGFLSDGRMLIVSMRDRKVLRREADGSLVTHADLYGLAPWHLNDMLVDHDGPGLGGQFWVRSHGWRTALYHRAHLR